MTTVSGTFSGDGVSNVLRLRGAPETVAISVAGGYTGNVTLERSVTAAESAWETALGPFNATAGFSGSYISRPHERLRLRAQGFSGSSAYSFADGVGVLKEFRNSENVVVTQLLENGDRIVGDLYVTGTLYVAGSPATISVAGTANEITATGATAVTLSLPAALTFSGKTITGGSYVGAALNGTLGAGTPAAAVVTTLSASGQITSTLATGTAPLVVASTTQVANLNAASLGGATFAAPGSIGSGTPGAGSFTTIAASDVASLADGAVGAPGLAFTSDPDSGFYRVGANNVGLALGGFLSVDFVTVASAVNRFKILTAATGGGPELQAIGSDADIPIKVTPKGAGYFHVTATGIKFPDNTTQATAAASGVSGIFTLDATATITGVAGDQKVVDCSAAAKTYTMPTSGIAGGVEVQLRKVGAYTLTIDFGSNKLQLPDGTYASGTHTVEGPFVGTLRFMYVGTIADGTTLVWSFG